MNHNYTHLPCSSRQRDACCAVRAVRIQMEMGLLSGDDESCLLQLAQLVAAALGRPPPAASLQPPALLCQALLGTLAGT